MKRNKELINEKRRLTYKGAETKRDRSEYQRQYREDHKEEKQARGHVYWLENKEAINAKRSENFSCAARGGRHVRKHKLTHEKSQKHQTAIDNPHP